MANIYTVNLNNNTSGIPYISNFLLESIHNSLKNWKKVILYNNRRWEASAMICNGCQLILWCQNCDLSLKVHLHPPKLVCHFCGFSQDIPSACPSCNSVSLRKIWTGTENIEQKIKKVFKEHSIFRLDSDSLKTVKSKKEALEKINESDILIWTQLITSWLSFEKIWTIWVILLEQGLSIPEYNIVEQLFRNVRRIMEIWSENGDDCSVILQTFIPTNDTVKSITEMNYKDFFSETLKLRKKFDYPPYSELASVQFRDKSPWKAKDFITLIYNKLTSLNKNNDLFIHLSTTPIKRQKNYIFKIIIKWHNIREFLKSIKPEVIKNQNLILVFDDLSF